MWNYSQLYLANLDSQPLMKVLEIMQALSVDVEVAFTECMALTDVDEFQTF